MLDLSCLVCLEFYAPSVLDAFAGQASIVPLKLGPDGQRESSRRRSRFVYRCKLSESSRPSAHRRIIGRTPLLQHKADEICRGFRPWIIIATMVAGVQRHDQGLYELQSFDNGKSPRSGEVAIREVIARAAIIITFIVSHCPPIVRPTIEPRFSERKKYLSILGKRLKDNNVGTASSSEPREDDLK